MRILLIEDNLDHQEIFQEYLSMSSFANAKVTASCSMTKGVELLETEAFDILFLDLSLNDSDISESLNRIETLTVYCPVVVLTSLDDRETLLSIIAKGAEDCLPKSELNDLLLERSIRFSIDRWQLRKKVMLRGKERHTIAVHLSEIIEATRVGTWEWNVQTGEAIFNSRWAEVIGYTLDELEPISIDTWFNIAHSEDFDVSQAALKQHFSRKLDYYDVDGRIRHKDGHWVWVNDRGKVVEWTDSGEPLWMRGTQTDITERKLVEESLRQFKDIVASSSDMLALLDTKFIYLAANSAYLNVFHKTEADLVGQSVSKIFGEKFFNDVIRPHAQRCLAAEEVNYQEWFHFPDSSPKYMDVHYYPYIAANGKVAGMVVNGRDITRQHEVKNKLLESEHKFRTLVEATGILPWKFDLRTGRFNYVGEQSVTILDIPVRSWTDMDSWSKRIHPEDRQPSIDFRRTSTEAGENYDCEYRFISGNREIIWIRDIVTIVKDEKGEAIELVGYMLDITTRKEAEDNQRLAASVFKHSQEGVVITDVNNHIIDANPASLKLSGYTREEVLGKDPHIFSSGNHPPSFYASLWQTLNEHGHWQGEIQNRRKTGEFYTERLSIDAVSDKDGNRQHYVGVFSDISYLKEHAVALREIAYNDTLTGLPNRLLLQDRMQQALSRSDRQKEQIAVCYLDLDSFKPVNDNYGHQAGDQLLIELAKRLQRNLRTGDTVARLGGDEFVMLVLDIHTASELEQLLARVLKTIAEPYDLQGTMVTLSASIGIATHPPDSGEADTLLRHADQSMYTAKQAGKNRYCFFNPREEQRAMADSLIRREIEIALAHGQLQLYYQPKINMASGAMAGVEALVRWQHPERGLLTPDAFLPVIERSELIIDLGHWVLNQALSQMRAWRAEGIEVEVSVNIAALQLQRTGFVSSLKALLAEFPDVPASYLQLEILETAALLDIEAVSKIITQCAEFGVTFALDDFGTGYSSLAYLRHLPSEVLKIDQSFIRNLLDDPEDLAITKGILGLARAFNRTVVAEGVESVAHGTLLLELGCKLAQGYSIARPMLASELPSWLENYKIPSEWKKAGLDYMI